MAYDKSARPNRKGRKKVCAFCVEKVDKIDSQQHTAAPVHTTPPLAYLP